MFVEFIRSLESNEGGNGGREGKALVVAVVVVADEDVGVEELKLFNDGKFGEGKPNGGNAPNGGMVGKPNGRPQGRSKQKI